MKTIQCAHPPHHHNGFVATCRLWTASGGVYIYIYILDRIYRFETNNVAYNRAILHSYMKE